HAPLPPRRPAAGEIDDRVLERAQGSLGGVERRRARLERRFRRARELAGAGVAAAAARRDGRELRATRGEAPLELALLGAERGGGARNRPRLLQVALARHQPSLDAHRGGRPPSCGRGRLELLAPRVEAVEELVGEDVGELRARELRERL